MSPEFRSLLRKEWAERRSMFRLGLVLVVAFVGYCVAYEFEYRTRALIASYYSTCLMVISLGAILLAMSTATGEYSQRTLKFSSSLPVSLSKVAWARLFGAWGCLAFPIICGAIFVTMLLATGLVEQAGLRMEHDAPNYLSLPDRPSLSRFAGIGFLWTTTAISVTYALHLSTLLSLLGTRCRNEGTVGFFGAVGAVFSFIFTTVRPTLNSLGLYVLSDWIGGLLPVSLAINWGYGELDGSIYTDLELAPLIFGPIAVNLLITAALATWFTRWYGSRVDADSRPTKSWRRWLPRLRIPSIAARLAIRWPGRFAALTWLNSRQAVPLSIAGLLMAVVITLIGLNESQSGGSSTVAMRLAGELPDQSWFVGVLWAAIVAVGIFSSELKPGLEHFWRSRPISPGQWFWMKFSVGMIAVLGVLDVIPALLAWGPMNVPASSDATSMKAYLACMPLVHAQVYAVAVAAVCRMRRPIPAAIFALLLYFVIDAVLKSIPGHEHLSTIDVHNSLVQAEKRHGTLDLTSAGYPIVYGIVVAVIIGATVLARRTLLPPRSSRRAITTAILLAMSYTCCPAHVQGAERPTAADIVAGIRQREALVKDVRMRLSSRQHRTAIFLEFDQAARRRRRSATPNGDTQEAIYELSERSPCRAWSEFGPDGALQKTIAFDGQLIRSCVMGYRPLASREAENNAPSFLFLSPETALMSFHRYSLTELLGSEELSSVSQREVDGEQLIDFTITPAVSPGIAHDREAGFPRIVRYQVTVNATRHYWPIRVNIEHSQSRDGPPTSKSETTTEGWINAGPLVYPKKLKSLLYLADRKSVV